MSDFTAKCLGIFIRDMIEDRDAHPVDWATADVDGGLDLGDPDHVEFVDVSDADRPFVVMASGRKFSIAIRRVG